MSTVSISCPVNPSEDPEKVRAAVLSLFPDADLVLSEAGYEGTATLDHFSQQIRKQRILDAARGVLLKGRRGNRTRMLLNKQVATVGRVSFADRNPVLGGIEVTIENDDIDSLIDRVAPVTVDGEEVVEVRSGPASRERLRSRRKDIAARPASPVRHVIPSAIPGGRRVIGVSCTGFSSRPVSEWIGPVSEHFRLWEIFSEADQAVCRDPEGIGALFEERRLVPQVHAPICDWNIGAMSDRLREASLQETLDTIDAAVGIGAKVVTVHPGLASMAVPGLEERAVALANQSVRSIARHVDGMDVSIGIENMPVQPFFLGRTAEQLARIVDGTDLGITFDIGHANTTGQIDAMIDLFRDRIVNIHIHDNMGDRDAHMTIGEGSIDFRHVIRRLSGYSGNWIIESKSLGSAVQSLPRLEKMLSDSGGTQVSIE